MDLEPLSLYADTLGTSDADLYTSPGGVFLSFVSFYNRGALSTGYVLKVRRGSNTVTIFSGTLATLIGADPTVGVLGVPLSEGDVVVGSASLASSIDCFLAGIQVA